MLKSMLPQGPIVMPTQMIAYPAAAAAAPPAPQPAAAETLLGLGVATLQAPVPGAATVFAPVPMPRPSAALVLPPPSANGEVREATVRSKRRGKCEERKTMEGSSPLEASS